MRWSLLGLAACGFQGRPVVGVGADGGPRVADAAADVAGPDASTLGDGLIAYYPLDTSPPATDAIGGPPATCLGNVGMPCPTPTAGKRAGALKFDGGTQWLSAAVGSGQQPAHFTVAFWASWATFPGSGKFSCPLGKDLNSSMANDNSWQLCLTHNGSAFAWLFVTEHHPTGGGGSPQVLTVAAQPAINTWYHFALVYDGAVKTLFVNGVAQSPTDPEAMPIVYDTSPLIFGGDVLNGTALEVPVAFGGALDDVRIYDRVLSSAELAALAEP